MNAAAQRIVPASTVSPEALVAAAWRMGDLSWKLDPHQLEIYDAFNEWNRRRHTPEYAELCKGIEGALDDVWVEEIARRFGKTVKWLVMLFELCIRRPGSVFTYATAHQVDIGDIIVPLAEQIGADAPDDLRPVYRGSFRAYGSPVLHIPATDSVIKLVGVDVKPNGLRGRFSDGVVLSECAFMRNLEELCRAVLLPQFQRRPWAFLALETSTPEDIDHDFLRVFRPDAEARKAYQTRTIDDNKVISAEEKAKHIRQAGGRGHHTCEREYYCQLTRDPERMIVPEFNRQRHVRAMKRPAYAHCFTVLDPGMSDRLAILWGYWDWMAQVLVIERSWAEFNAGTDVVARVLRDTERELWGGAAANDNGSLLYWSPDKRRLMPNPVERWTDVDLRLAHDLANLHGINVSVIDKPAGSADADVQQMRMAVHGGQVVVLPESGPLASELEAGKRKLGGAPGDWERSPVYGHYDCLAALKYMCRKVFAVRSRNPFPPEGALLTGEAVFREPWADHHQVSKSERALGAVFGGGGRRKW